MIHQFLKNESKKFVSNGRTRRSFLKPLAKRVFARNLILRPGGGTTPPSFAEPPPDLPDGADRQYQNRAGGHLSSFPPAAFPWSRR
jgi:hypothetical protein